jgi:hypothetical protein
MKPAMPAPIGGECFAPFAETIPAASLGSALTATSVNDARRFMYSLSSGRE